MMPYDLILDAPRVLNQKGKVGICCHMGLLHVWNWRRRWRQARGMWSTGSSMWEFRLKVTNIQVRTCRWACVGVAANSSNMPYSWLCVGMFLHAYVWVANPLSSCSRAHDSRNFQADGICISAEWNLVPLSDPDSWQISLGQHGAKITAGLFILFITWHMRMYNYNDLNRLLIRSFLIGIIPPIFF